MCLCVEDILTPDLDPSCILLPPKSRAPPAKTQLTSIAVALATRTGAKMAQVNTALKNAVVEEWGKVRRIDSEEGDTMRSCSLGVVSEDRRDATYVWVSLLLNWNEPG